MCDSNASGNKSIQEVEKLRRRVAKLEQVNRKLSNPKHIYDKMGKVLNEWQVTFDAIKDSVMVIDNNYRVLRANIATSRLLGKPLKDIVGKICWQLVHGTEEPPDECPLKKALSTKKHEESELYISEKDIWVETSVDPIIDEECKITSLVHTVKNITKRKRTEETLRKSEGRFRRLYEKAPLGYQSLNLEGRLIEVNQAWLDLLGYESKVEVVGRWFGDFLAPYEVEAYKKRFPNFKETGVVHTEVDMKRSDESIVKVHIDGVIARDELGNFQQTHCILHDITERKRAEEAMRESEERFRTLFEQMPSGVAVYEAVDDGEDFIFRDFNGTAEKIEKIKRSDLIGKRVTDVFPGVKELGVFEVIQRVWKTGKSEYFPDAIYKDNRDPGSWRESWISKLPSGYIVAVYNDITKRKKIEQSLVESRARYERLFEHMPIVCFTFDRQGKILSWNLEAENIYGYSKKEAIGANSYDLIVTEKTKQVTREVIEKVFKGEDVVGSEWQDRNKAGKVGWRIGNTFPLFRSDGSVECGVNLNIDITKRKKAEKLLRDSQENFRIVSEMTSDYIAKVRVETDGQLVLESATDRLANNTGYPLDELRDQDSWSKIVHPDDYDKFHDFWKTIISSRESCELLFRGIDQKEEFEWLHAIGKPILDEKNERVTSIIFAAIDITERKEAEDALKDSEMKFRLVTETIEDVFWMSTPGVQEMAYISPSYETIWGRSCKSLYETPMSFMEVVHPDDRDKLTNIVKDYHSLGKPYSCEYRIIPSDGSLRWISERGFPVFDEHGNLHYMTGVCTDITERKKAGNALVESERKFRSIFDNANDVIVFVTKFGKILEVNAKVKNALGYDSDELIGKNFITSGILSIRNTAAIVKSFKEAVNANGFPHEQDLDITEVWLNHKNGCTVLFEASTTAIKKDGKLEGFLSILRDVTESRKAQEAYRSLVDHSLQGLTIFQEGRVAFANRTMAQITGYSVEEMLAMPPEKVRAFVHPEDRELVWNRHKERLERKVPQERYEIRGIRKDGSVRWLEIDASLVEYQGKPAIQAAYIDITKRKEAEEKLRQESRMRNILIDHLPCVAVILRKSTREIVASNEAARQVGAVPGKTCYGTCADRDEPCPFCLGPEIWDTNEPRRLEVESNGKYYEGIWVPLSDDLYVHYIFDITERKSTEEAYRTLVDHSLQGLAIFQEGRIVFANEAMAQITGYNVDEMLVVSPKVIREFIHPEDRKMVWSRHQQRLEGKRPPERYEFRGICKNGSVRWIEVDANRVEYRGKPAIQAAYLDITELKKAKQQEQEYIRKLQYLSEAATEFVKLTPDQDIYILIAEKLKELSDGSIVAVNTWDHASERLCVRAVLGLGKYTQAITQIMGYNPVGRFFPLDDAAREGLSQGKLLKVPNGIYDLTPGIPKMVCQSIEKLLGLGDVYAMGLNSEGQLYGSVTILTRIKTGLKNHKLIETFMNQAAVAIHRWQIVMALRESEEKFRNLFNNAEVGMFRSRLDGSEFLESNDKYLSILGRTREEVIGKPTKILWADPKDREKMVNILKKQGYVNSFECRMLDKAGEVINCLTSLRLYPETGILEGSILDITERKQAEEALRESEHRFKTLFECAPDGIYLHDMNGTFVDGNKVAEQMIGFKREELIGSNFTESGFLPAEEIPKAVADLKKSINGEPTGPDEFTLLHKNGSQIPVEIRTFPVKIQDKNLVLGIARDITERKRAEDALADNEQRLKLAIDSANLGTWDWDVISGKIIWGGEHANLFGYKSDQFDGSYETFRSSIHPDDWPDLSEAVKESLKDGSDYSHEYRIVWPDGSIHWIRGSGRPLLDQKGKAVRMIGIVYDITNRRLAEEALRTSEARLSEAMKIAKLAYWEYDVADNVFLFNDQFYRIYRSSVEQVGGYRVSPQRYAELFIHPNDSLLLAREIQEAIETDDPKFKSEVEHRIIYGDGNIGYISVRYYVVKDGQGRTIKTYGVNQDITERKKAEEALITSEEKYKSLFDNSIEGIGLAKGNRIVSANKALLDIFGYDSLDEFTRIPLLDHVAPESKQLLRNIRLEREKGTLGREYSFEYKIICKDGTIKDLDTSTTQISLEREAYTLSTFRDITERKRAEDKLQEYQDKLKAMASKILQTEEDERKRIATGLHDHICQKLVMTKLALEASLQLISDSNVSKSIKVACDSIGETIEETDSLTFELSNPLLRELGFISAMEKYVSEELQQKHGITFEFKADEQLNIKDEKIKNSLFRVSRELLMNIVKHAHAHKVKISAMKKQDRIHIVVQDDGVGFDSDKSSMNGSKTDRFGLFSIREQLEHLGGTFTIKSEPSKGTTATVVVPSEKKVLD